ncbi:hypothetical protein A1355_03275 [Methylomonas koyamae]|uniref:Uncharacterized protein n=1 Tax=Methylomonas koyamae TaxID=702114 RepID=A0A177NQ15_9GAMM|nr:hypothetical protein A1355_03275 [Methylomonas koyamae]
MRPSTTAHQPDKCRDTKQPQNVTNSVGINDMPNLAISGNVVQAAATAPHAPDTGDKQVFAAAVSDAINASHMVIKAALTAT